MKKLFILVTVIVVIVMVYFFSFQLQKFLSMTAKAVSKKVGTYSADKEYSIQRYVYLHRGSPVTKLYNWINEQLVASGLKRAGVTPVGYMMFWMFIAIITTLLLGFLLGLKLVLYVPVFCILVMVFLVTTRVVVSERMEKREAEVMDALDLIIPEIGGGVKNAIARYADNFAPSLQQDFKIFLSNIQDRGMSFEDAMFVLSDNLGVVFKDFAQKAIFFETLGEVDMIDIFTDITETNRQRRELRYINNIEFGVLRVNFGISSLITCGYFIFLMFTDSFSRYFFLSTTAGMVLLVVILLMIFGVFAYISTIKSRAI